MSIAEKLVTIAENEQKVYNAGQKAEYDRFWDAVQNSGNRINYNRGFCGYTWTDENFKPKYDIRPSVPSGAYSLFCYAGITDLAGALEKQGVVLDTSNASGLFQEMFSNSNITRIPTLDITKASGSAAVTNMFANCKGLTTIEKIIISENTPTGYMFNGVSNLENVIFEGVIGNNIDFSTCSKLTHESLMSIINALKDFSGTETFANVDYRWDGNYPYEYNPKNDFVYNVKSASFSSGELQLFLETDTDLDLVLVANDINYSGDLSKIKTAMISSDGTLTLTFEPTTTKTLTIGSTNLDKLTDAEKKIATDKGWTLA